jgi:DNA recombination protein Rad52
MRLTAEQYEVLLKPLAASRVAHRSQGGMQLSYLEAWDVKAHLIRIFGFGGWSADVLSADLMFEDKDEKGRWNVGYKVVMRLRIHAGDAWEDTTYTEAAVGSATLPQRGEAHDMAVKTAESDALKRAAINLGTQFGLSLYDNGSRADVVKHTLRAPEGVTEPETVAAPDGIVDQVMGAEDIDALRGLWESASVGGWLDAPVIVGGSETVLRGVIADRVAEIQEAVN